MEHKRRVRKVQERPDTATLMGLLMENANDMMAENEQLRGEIERLKQHEQDMDQCDPDTVMARVESQLWVAGDLGLLRDAMVLQTRGRRRKRTLTLFNYPPNAPREEVDEENKMTFGLHARRGRKLVAATTALRPTRVCRLQDPMIQCPVRSAARTR